MPHSTVQVEALPPDVWAMYLTYSQVQCGHFKPYNHREDELINSETTYEMVSSSFTIQKWLVSITILSEKYFEFSSALKVKHMKVTAVGVTFLTSSWKNDNISPFHETLERRLMSIIHSPLSLKHLHVYLSVQLYISLQRPILYATYESSPHLIHFRGLRKIKQYK